MKADNIRKEPGMTMRSKVKSNDNLLRLSLQMILDEFDELLWVGRRVHRNTVLTKPEAA